jgi:hypothetical protein
MQQLHLCWVLAPRALWLAERQRTVGVTVTVGTLLSIRVRVLYGAVAGAPGSEV